jgi:hypothetical protein
MRFLIPTASRTDAYGVLTTFQHRAVPQSIQEGALWAGDNCAFTGFDEVRFFEWVDRMTEYRATCLFVVVPDSVGDVAQTLGMFAHYAPMLVGWPLAFVAQDGQETLDFPCADLWSTLFVGGSTSWKESGAAVDCIKAAQALGKRIHIGRVNYWRRYAMFRVLAGSENFTCDGTRIRYERDACLAAWAGYEAQGVLLTL